MEIVVKGFASMGAYTSHLGHQNKLKVHEGATIGDLFKILGVPGDAKKVIIVNGRHKTEAYVMNQDDTVIFFPPLEGG